VQSRESLGAMVACMARGEYDGHSLHTAKLIVYLKLNIPSAMKWAISGGFAGKWQLRPCGTGAAAWPVLYFIHTA
jgi:hypothetical protein